MPEAKGLPRTGRRKKAFTSTDLFYHSDALGHNLDLSTDGVVIAGGPNQFYRHPVVAAVTGVA